MFEQIVTFVSLGISAMSVIFNLICVQYQTRRKENFEKEKITLEYFADFLAMCSKKNQDFLTASEEAEFLRINARLSLIADNEIFEATRRLVERLSKNPHSEEIAHLISTERKILQKRLKIFNRH